MVTVSLDHGEVLAPLARGDFLRVEATVVAVGSSSLTLRVVARKERAAVAGKGRPGFARFFEAQMTFVAVDGKGRPLRAVPELEIAEGKEGEAVGRLQAEVKAAKVVVRERADRAQGLRQGCVPGVGEALDEFSDIRESLMSIDDSRVEFRKQYLPRHENFGGIVFGMWALAFFFSSSLSSSSVLVFLEGP